MHRVSLNVDLGELPNEPAELFAIATIANVACGGHAGDHASMARAVALCRGAGTLLAAHPSYPDRAGFGRRTIAVATADLERSVATQCAALRAIAVEQGLAVAAMKPHGALYHDAARSEAIARAVVDGALAGLGGGSIAIVGPPGGALALEARRRGLPYAREGFADRGLRPDGTLVPRGEPGALLGDPEVCAAQAVRLATSGELETIGVHGDSPGAVAIALAVRDALRSSGLLLAGAGSAP